MTTKNKKNKNENLMSLFVRAFKLVKIVVLDYCKALDICGAIIVLGIF
jgi:hypothetical protein